MPAVDAARLESVGVSAPGTVQPAESARLVLITPQRPMHSTAESEKWLSYSSGWITKWRPVTLSGIEATSWRRAPMNVEQRKQIAAETINIMQDGFYSNPHGEEIYIRDAVRAALAHTQMYTPDELHDLYRRMKSEKPPPEAHPTQISVTNQTSLAAANELAKSTEHYPVMVLNFASAKNPGGGFLSGSEAQEEHLVRSSALYETLIAVPGFYEANRACSSPLYTDHAILSQHVPVIRNDQGMLLDKPYLTTFITMPAPNAGAYRSGDDRPVREVMRRRINLVLSLAAKSGCKHLVLGAWGCGVFGNDPSFVARAFSKALSEQKSFHGRFRRIIFAVDDRSTSQRFIRPFEKIFGGYNTANGSF